MEASSAPERNQVARRADRDAPLTGPAGAVANAASVPVVTPAVQIRDLPPADLNSVAMIHGRVVTPDGSGVGGVWVYLNDEAGKRTSSRSDADGNVLLVDVQPGRTRVGCNSLEWRSQTRVVELAPGTTELVEFVLEPIGTIGLRCSKDGDTRFFREIQAEFGHVVDFQALVTQERPAPTLVPPHPGGNNPYGAGAWWSRGQIGMAEIEAPDDFGALAVDADFPVWASLAIGNVVVHSERVTSSGAELVWRIDPASLRSCLSGLRLSVVDAMTGEPVAASVAVDHRRQVMEGGELELSGMNPGRHSVTIRATGFAAERLDADLVGGETFDLGVIQLVAPVRVSGAVLAKDPKSGSLVPVESELLVESVGSNFQLRAETDDQGHFSIDTLRPGEYTVRVRGDDEGRYPGAPDTVWSSHATRFDTRGGGPQERPVYAVPVSAVAIHASARTAPLELTVSGTSGEVIRRATLTASQTRAYKLPVGAVTLLGRRAGEVVLEQPLELDQRSKAVYLDLPR